MNNEAAPFCCHAEVILNPDVEISFIKSSLSSQFTCVFVTQIQTQ